MPRLVLVSTERLIWRLKLCLFDGTSNYATFIKAAPLGWCKIYSVPPPSPDSFNAENLRQSVLLDPVWLPSAE